MITRVTDNIKFNMITNSMFNIQSEYGKLMEKLSTQKAINRPSDDPIGTSDILDSRTAINAIQQYQTNITDADISLSVTETALSSMKKLLADAVSIAISESGASGSVDTMDTSAATVSALIDEALSLMNTKNGDSYLFGGSRTDVAPFSSTPVSSIGNATAAQVNNFDGTVTTGGSYTGIVNKTYALRIIDGGTSSDLSDAQYQVSVDGGTIWGATQTDLSGPINFGDGLGVTMTFNAVAGAHTLTANDSFTVNATAARIGNATQNVLNFDGTVTSGGNYTETVNHTYRVEIVDGGTPETLANATYHISIDGGAWGTTQSLSALVVEGSVANTTDGTTPILAGTHWDDIFGAGVQNNDSITITGTSHDGTIVSDSYTIANTATGTVQDLLSQIQTAYGGTVTASIDTAGVITLTDTRAGDSQLTMTLVANNESGALLDFGAITPSPSTTTTTSVIDLGYGVNMTIGDTGANRLTDGDLFTVNAGAARIGDATVAPVNTFNGTVASDGTYTGTENKTYVLKIMSSGTLPIATYQISSDGGVTWGTTQTDLSSQITLGEGIKMAFTAGTQNLAVGDSFMVNAIATDFDDVSASTVNNFNGTVASGGTYTGAENKAYAVKIITDGPLATATYKVSEDGGKTWDSEQNFPAREVKDTVAMTAWSSPVMASTIWNEIDGAVIKDGTTIAITGTDHSGNAIGGLPADTYTITNAATGTVQDLLDKIEASFSGAVTATIDTTGKITVRDNETGDSHLALTLTTTNPTGGTLALGVFNETTTKTITLGDEGISVTFTPGTNDFKANDLFTVNAYAAGFYHGNNDNLTVQIGRSNNLAYNITGSSAFTAENGGEDVLATLYALKDALSTHNTDLISTQTEKLQTLETQVLQSETLSGAKRSSLELTSSNHDTLKLQITNRLADIENADLTELITEFQMKQIAMQASYSMASKISSMTIMDYLS